MHLKVTNHWCSRKIVSMCQTEYAEGGAILHTHGIGLKSLHAKSLGTSSDLPYSSFVIKYYTRELLTPKSGVENGTIVVPPSIIWLKWIIYTQNGDLYGEKRWSSTSWYMIYSWNQLS